MRFYIIFFFSCETKKIQALWLSFNSFATFETWKHILVISKPQARGGIPIVSMYLYLIHRNFFRYRSLNYNYLVKQDVYEMRNKRKKLYWKIMLWYILWQHIVSKKEEKGRIINYSPRPFFHRSSSSSCQLTIHGMSTNYFLNFESEDKHIRSPIVILSIFPNMQWYELFYMFSICTWEHTN